jgi:hypothetical protein
MSIKAWQPAPDPNKMTCCAEHRLSEVVVYTVSKPEGVQQGIKASPDNVVPDVHRQPLFKRPVLFRVELRQFRTLTGQEIRVLIRSSGHRGSVRKTHTTLDGRDVREQVDVDHAKCVVFHRPIEHFATHVELGATICLH